MDESSEETKAYDSSPTGEDAGAREEGQSNGGQETQPSPRQQMPDDGSRSASAGGQAPKASAGEREAGQEDASSLKEEQGSDVNPGV